MPTYSFQDVHAALTGPGGSLSLSEGDGVAQEGITVEPTGDKNFLTVGACGGLMHSLSASKASIVTLRLLKTSPLNEKLQNMYNQQTASATTHGKNTITIRDVARGDTTTITEAAFKRQPSNSYAREGNVLDWQLEGNCDTQLGTGAPEAL